MIKQRVALVATWDNICEVLPADVRLALTPPEHPASWEAPTASLFGSPNLAPDEQRIFAVLRADELTHLDALVERLVAKLSSSQIFVPLFELELSGRIRAPRGGDFTWESSRCRECHFGIKRQSC